VPGTYLAPVWVLLSSAMPAKKSAGILVYRKSPRTEVLLVHPGGPYWTKKDAGAWTIPKGEIDENEDPLAAAKRELREETGVDATGQVLPLTPIRQKSGKWVHAWAVEGECDAAAITSNTFMMEWPPRSGKQQEFPEVDRAAWFSFDEARAKIIPAQVPLLDELERLLA
jgi:predicted NUDIX family NTP pyrophosphohydrolase